MPTRNRREFVPAAIRAFLRQDYEHRELLVVDDGTDPVADLVPDDPRIRYERVPRVMRLGEKRNLACRMATGDVIAHWDDDDWSAPWRLTYQVAGLRETGSEVCGLSEVFFFDPRTGRAWRYVHPPKGARPWVAGGTLCYTKSFWLGHSFAEVNVGEDTRFVYNGRPRIAALRDPNFYVAMIHARNTSPKRPGGSRWRKADGEAVRRMFAEDVPAVLTGRSQAPPRPAPVWGSTTGEAVTVSIPYYGCKEYIRRAVESVLAQTHRNLVVVVVNDADPDPPWDELAAIDDPRLVRFDLRSNGGRYLADAVVLAASPNPYFLVQDADDWSEPDRVEKLLRRLVDRGADVAVSSIEVIRAGSRKRGLVRPMLDAPLGPRVQHRVDHHALFRTDALTRLGGCYGGLRIGFDTLLMNLMLMAATVAVVEEPLYHRLVRPGSLTTSSATGFGSTRRKQAQQEVAKRYGVAYEAFRRHADGKLGRAALEDALRALTRGSVAAGDAERIAAEAERLRPLLLAAKARSPRPARGRPRLPSVHDLVRDEALWTGAWSIRRSTAVEMAERLRVLGSRRMLEAGSGTSTVVLAAHAARTGGRVVALEHDARYARSTRALLERYGLAEWAEVRHAPLEDLTSGPAAGHPWYDEDLDGDFEFCLLDGPPQSRGRHAALFGVHPHLAGEWEVWLHDAKRDHERSCVDLWRKHLAFSSSRRDVDDAGVCILTARAGTQPPRLRVPADVAVGVLTSHRLDLLEQTIEGLVGSDRDVLDEAYVCVLVNGHDPASEAYARHLPFVDKVVAREGATLPVGKATSTLMAALARESGRTYALHLEDDWSFCTVDGECIDRARRILATDPGTGQVRLRHRSEAVLTSHMVTRKPIVWEETEGYARSRSAHFTFNPSMMRIDDLARIFPAADEHDAQVRFLRTRMATAQLRPGVFRHIGEHASLRLKLDRRAVRGAPRRRAARWT